MSIDKLESIVAELVEKRFVEAVIDCIDAADRTDPYSMGALKKALHEKILELTKEEVEKHAEEIRTRIIERINAHVDSFKPNVSISFSQYY